jgi:hypothetical protein
MGEYAPLGARRRIEGESTDYFGALRDRVTVQGACFVLDGKPDEYGIYKGQPAHRAIYAAVNGPIPKGWDVHHTCEVKGCINPRHLFCVTPVEHGEIHGARRRWGGPAM